VTIKEYDTTYAEYPGENTQQHNTSKNYSILFDDKGFFIEIQFHYGIVRFYENKERKLKKLKIVIRFVLNIQLSKYS